MSIWAFSDIYWTVFLWLFDNILQIIQYFWIIFFKKHWYLFPNNSLLFLDNFSLFPEKIHSFLALFSLFPDTFFTLSWHYEGLTVRKSWKRFKFWWRYADGIEWKSYTVLLTVLRFVTFTPPHQPIFNKISTFVNFFLLVYIYIYKHCFLEIFILRNFSLQIFIFKYALKVLSYNIDGIDACQNVIFEH